MKKRVYVELTAAAWSETLSDRSGRSEARSIDEYRGAVHV
jgi:hypothetical protein